MAAVDYFVLLGYLNTGGLISRREDGKWVAVTGQWREYFAVKRAAKPSHRFNSDDDRDALQTQAAEAADLLGMGSVCDRCRGSNGVPRGVAGCPDCGGSGWLNDSASLAIDRLALADIGPVVTRDHHLTPRRVMPTGQGDDVGYFSAGAPTTTYTPPTASCETCGGSGRVMSHPEPFPIACPSCRGTKKDNQGRPVHEHQQPYDRSPGARCECLSLFITEPKTDCSYCGGEGRIVHGPGVRGLRNVVSYVTAYASGRIDDHAETDYPCGTVPDHEVWERISFQRFSRYRQAGRSGKDADRLADSDVLIAQEAIRRAEEETGHILILPTPEAVTAKREKVSKHMRLSRERGRLD